MTHTTSGPTRAKLESNVKIICTEMDENSFRRDDNDCRDMFITTHILEKIWPEERLEEFFEGYPWADKKFVQRVHQKFLKVLSVLVRLQCSDLEIFKNCFYDTGKEDSNLPFHDLSEISELDTPVANDFRTHQYNFIPITIEENKDHTFSESYRFPFVKKSELIAEDKGSACVMYKEFVAPRQLININGESNAEETPVVRKSGPFSKAPHNMAGEIEALRRFRSLLFNNERIMTCLCTITHGDNLDIIFALADLDLEDLLSGKPSSNLISEASPKDLIIELAGLANALGYLHNDLRTSEGESLVCVHNDIKPENILIFCHRDLPVGRWKISDFGLARFKKVVNDSENTDDLYINFQDTSFRHISPSLTSPKRGPGSFQAPEVERQGQKVIGPESDVFSLGCISSRVVTYAVGGAKLVRDFDRKRGRESQQGDHSTSHGNDFFHRNNGREANVEVLSWLNELGKGDEEQTAWIQACVKIIKPMLEIDVKMRPIAHDVGEDLLNEVVPKFCTSSENASSVSQGGSTTSSTPSIDVPEKTKIVYNNHRVRSWSYSFSRVKLPDDEVAQTAFSSSRDYLAFLSPNNVRVVPLALLEKEHYWTEKEDPEEILSDQSTVIDIKAPDTAYWQAMALSKDHLALRTADAVYVHKLKTSPDCKMNNTCVLERLRFKHQLFAVAVSVNGDVILQFENYVMVYIQSDAWEEHKLETRGTLQSVIFNSSGDWIVAWCVDKGSVYAYFWQISDLSQSHRKMISSSRDQSFRALNKQILAFNHSPSFALWDESQGQVGIIYGPSSSQETSFSKDSLDDIKTGIIAPADKAIVLVRKDDSNSNGNDQVSIIPLCLNSNELLEPGTSLDICKIKAPATSSCGIAVTAKDQSGMVKDFLVAHPDGFIEKIEISFEED